MRDVKLDPGLLQTQFQKFPKVAALLQLSLWDPGLFFQEGSGERSWAM